MLFQKQKVTLIQSLQTWKHDTVEKEGSLHSTFCHPMHLPILFSYPICLVTGTVVLGPELLFKYVMQVCKACNFSSSFGNEWIFWNQEFKMFFRKVSTQNLPVTST